MTENNDDKDRHELEKIRLKKMQALMEAQKRKQESQDKTVSLFEKIDYVLKAVLNPDAFNHLNNIKNNEPYVYERILNELVSPEVVSNIDYLMAIISQRGGVQRRIPLDAIIYLERQAKGIKSKIKVKQGDGKMMDLGSFLSK